MPAKKLSFALFLSFFIMYIASAQQGKWQILKTKNDIAGRSECGMAACNGKLYLIGGDGGPSSVEVFDPAALSWTKKAAMPITMHHFEAVALGSKIYVLDAFSEGGFPNQKPMANVYIYDTQKDSWQKGAEVPVARRRGGAGAAAYGGKLYLVAGIQHGHSSGTTNMFDVYDPVTDTWAVLPDAPHIRDHSTAVVVHDKLYAVGGRNTSYHEADNFMSFFSKTVLDVDCYDFKTGKWTTLDAKLPLGTGGGATVNLNNKIYYIGGERATDTRPNGPQKNTYFLDSASSGGWIETDSLNLGRNGTAAAVLNNKIYLAGGSGGGPGGPPPGQMAGGNRPPMPTGGPGGNGPGTPMPQDSSHHPQPGGPQGGGGGKLTVEVFNLN